MSAECPKHGTDLVYPSESWPGGVCPVCEAEAETEHLLAAAKIGGKLVEDTRADRDRWIRAFNRLEKAVTNHVADCIDSDGLAHAHGAVMRDLGPAASPSNLRNQEETNDG